MTVMANSVHTCTHNHCLICSQVKMAAAGYESARHRYMAHDAHRFEPRRRWSTTCKVCGSRKMWHDWANPEWMRGHDER